MIILYSIPIVCRSVHVLFTLFVFAWHSGVHHILCFVFRRLVCTINKDTTIKYRDYKNLDENKLLEDMGKIDWESIRTMTDVNQM